MSTSLLTSCTSFLPALRSLTTVGFVLGLGDGSATRTLAASSAAWAFFAAFSAPSRHVESLTSSRSRIVLCVVTKDNVARFSMTPSTTSQQTTAHFPHSYKHAVCFQMKASSQNAHRAHRRKTRRVCSWLPDNVRHEATWSTSFKAGEWKPKPKTVGTVFQSFRLKTLDTTGTGSFQGDRISSRSSSSRTANTHSSCNGAPVSHCNA